MGAQDPRDGWGTLKVWCILKVSFGTQALPWTKGKNTKIPLILIIYMKNIYITCSKFQVRLTLESEAAAQTTPLRIRKQSQTPANKHTRNDRSTNHHSATLTGSLGLHKDYQLGLKTLDKWLMENWTLWWCKRYKKKDYVLEIREKNKYTMKGLADCLTQGSVSVSLMVGTSRYYVPLNMRKYETHVTKNPSLNLDKSLDLISNLQE